MDSRTSEGVDRKDNAAGGPNAVARGDLVSLPAVQTWPAKRS